MNSSQDLSRRINRVISYIDYNLENNLDVESLAKVANISKFHFNRVFKSITNQSVYKYLQRIRIERAFYYLWNSNKTVKEISIMCGIVLPSSFTRSFRKRFGISPLEQRNLNTKWKNEYIGNDIDVCIKDLPKMTLAYIRKFGSFALSDTFTEESLYNWAIARNLWNKDSLIIKINYDSMFVTQEKHYRVDTCINVPEGTEPSGDISILEFPKTRLAVTQTDFITDYKKIRDKISDLDNWILKSGYRNSDYSPNLIFYSKKENFNKSDTITMDICFPIKPQ